MSCWYSRSNSGPASIWPSFIARAMRLSRWSIAYRCESLFRAGFKEFSRLYNNPIWMPMHSGRLRTVRVALMRETDRIEQHLPFWHRLVRLALTSDCWERCGASCIPSGAGQRNASHVGDRSAGHLGGVDRHGNGALAAIPAVLAYNRLAARATRC